MKITAEQQKFLDKYKEDYKNALSRLDIKKELEEAMQEHGYTYDEALLNLHLIPGIHEPSLPFVIEEVDMTEEEIEAKIQEIMDGYNSRLKEGEPRFTREEAQDIMMELGMVGEDFFDYYDKLFKRNQG